ncbi:MAG: flagellar hook protein FlgE [Acetobacter sp.]|jgi:flagellar hook protein FlgE|nr:flagellar hook protein FlgE [Acetobacter sp.]MCH4062549.1 flagellar hook protein FlgE [Acetobacter sp.]MCH4088605.1 flagellar hook protein FlgE [Acetobacter sp.]MCI1292511.1 flagellar hook protein FlgE [Acetobacter sp.]MCI1319391.1 flagellar hook protein FlgE [Acetobacter sp.]
MSIFNALTTAVTGLNAQSSAFTTLSNNIANSQTTGYKAQTTSFQDFVTGASSSGNASSDTVAAVTSSHNDNQGTISSSTNTLALAISGEGFFDVSQPASASTANSVTFSNQDYYTRNGDFTLNNDGYLVNTSGYYLNGYMVDGTTGQLSNSLSQIQIADIGFRPTETTTLTLTGTIGSSTSSSATPASYTSPIYDSQGTAHEADVTWTQDSSNPLSWTVSVTDPTNASAISANSYTVTFGSDGTVASIADSSGSSIGSTFSGSSAKIPITATYNGVPQTINLNLGTIGGTSGVTLSTASSTSSQTPQLASDSVTSGTYEDITMETDGSIMANFSNGDSQLVAKIALSNFANPDALEAVSGQAYVATNDSGSPKTGMVGANGTGTLKTSSTEGSTTDLTSDLSNLIVTQQAYSANTKIVTTANSMLQTTIDMIR